MVSRPLWLLLLIAGVAVTGCSGASDPDVDRVATSFYAAIADSDGATACRLLAPSTRDELESSTGKPCDEALLSEVDPVSGDASVAASGAGAQVHIGSDTAFLSKFAGGWLVTAAACTPPPAPDRPYDCQVKGG